MPVFPAFHSREKMKDPAAQWRPAAGGPTHNHLHAETRPRRFIPHANGSVNIQLGISPVPEEEGGGRGSVGRSGDWGCHRFQQRSNLSRQASDAVYSSPANRLIRPIHSARRNRSKSPALKSDWNRCPRQPLSITSWFPPPTIAADDATFILRRRIKRFSFLGSRRRFGRSSNATVPTDGWPPVSTRAKMRRFAKVLQYGYARRY